MSALHPSTPRSASRTVLEAVGLTVGAFVAATVAGVVFLVPLLVLGYDVRATAVLVAATAVGQVAMFGLGYGYVRYRRHPVPVAWPTRRDVGYVLGGVPLALVTAIGLSVVLASLDLLPGSVIADAAATDPTLLLGLAVLSLVVVAPVEEFVFRGVIQGRLRERFGSVPAVAGASLLFGSMHLANYSGRLVPVVAGALMIAVVGAVFGTLYERTGNLTVPVAVHGLYNLVLLGSSYLTTV